MTDTPGSALADPKDKREVLERYRAAIDFAAEHRWTPAIALLQGILRDEPDMADVWSELALCAMRLDRFDLAVDAYKHHIELEPREPTAYLGAAEALLKQHKLDEAREQARLAGDVAAEGDRPSRVSAHELLARIALARHDPEAAREEAALAHAEDATLPLPTYVDARVLYDQGRYEDALPGFIQAIDELKKSGAPPMTELHFYAADVLARLDRYADAEKEFVAELTYFPQNIRARGGLATLYQANGKTDAASQMLDDLIRITPTPDALRARRTALHDLREPQTGRSDQDRGAAPVREYAEIARNARPLITAGGAAGESFAYTR